MQILISLGKSLTWHLWVLQCLYKKLLTCVLQLLAHFITTASLYVLRMWISGKKLSSNADENFSDYGEFERFLIPQPNHVFSPDVLCPALYLSYRHPDKQEPLGCVSVTKAILHQWQHEEHHHIASEIESSACCNSSLKVSTNESLELPWFLTFFVILH